ncbi:MAG: hypothetical protein AAF772_04830 [Acidobacteriota bacterium]
MRKISVAAGSCLGCIVLLQIFDEKQAAGADPKIDAGRRRAAQGGEGW